MKCLNRTCHRPVAARQNSRRRGALTVEFALVAPMLFTLVFGLIEASRLAMIINTAENAAYEGARAAIIPGGTAGTASAKALALLNAVGAHGATAVVTPATITNATRSVTVTINIPMDQNAWISPTFSNHKTISRTCELVREKTSAAN